jgi:hypothetical protein
MSLRGADDHAEALLFDVLEGIFSGKHDRRVTRGIVFVGPDENNVPATQVHSVSPNELCKASSAGVRRSVPARAGGTSSGSS